MKKRFPLYIPISGLFLFLIIGSCVIIATFMAIRSRQTIHMVTEKSLGRVIKQTNEQMRLAAKTPLAVVDMGSRYRELVQAGTRQQRLQHLAYLRESLLALPNMEAVYLGYPDGDFFLLRRVAKHSAARHVFGAPESCYWAVQVVERDNSGNVLDSSFLYFDQNLTLMSQRDRVEKREYDPRSRPWYRQAMESRGAVRSDPYIFATSGKLGMTYARASAEAKGVVVAVDLRLESFSDILPDFKITPGSKLLILDNSMKLVGHLDPDQISSRDSNSGAVTHLGVADLEDPLFDVLTRKWQQGGRKDLLVAEYTVDGEKWLGAVARLNFSTGSPLYLMVGVPYIELYAKVREAGERSALITLGLILLTIPCGILAAWLISRPIKGLTRLAKAARRFDFSGKEATPSVIQEVDELSGAMGFLNQTIDDFLHLVDSLNKEKNFDSLLERIGEEARRAGQADLVFTYLLAEEERLLKPGLLCDAESCNWESGLPNCKVDAQLPLADAFRDNRVLSWLLDKEVAGDFLPLFDGTDCQQCTIRCMPLVDRQGSGMGVIALLYHGTSDEIEVQHLEDRLAFVHRFSSLAGVGLETQQLIKKQKALFDAFIRLIAGAIDAKSPYTGGHCQRVPVITKMLAQAACEQTEGPFADYQLSEEQWEELHVASWLHDCGKVTTPEYVVDKATKLETIYDRIHEVRMRFEVLKRDAEIECWQGIADGGNREQLLAGLAKRKQQLNEDFIFVAQCNEGGEFMAPELVERLHTIAENTWQRSLDDRIGVSWEEGQRKARTPVQELPVIEKLLSDREEHLFFKDEEERIPEDNPWGFKLDEPQYQFNRGELYNLQVPKGTLSSEERFKINDHIVQTIKMLEQLPYPKHLQRVPEIAGGHHETMIGSGYPRKLTGGQMSYAAKMMVIADVFEALTASDRPYKKAKSLSQAVKIMSFMHKDGHFDDDLFHLFLTSGVYKKYAAEYLAKEQVDEVNIEQYL